MSSTGKFTLRLIPAVIACLGMAGLLVSPRAVPSLLAQSAAIGGIVNTEDTRLNVRSGPGAAFAVIAKLDPGAEVEVLETSADGQWRRIRTADVGTDSAAWVAAEFVQLGEASDEAAATGSEETLVLLPTLTPTPDADGDAGAEPASAVGNVLKNAAASLSGRGTKTDTKMTPVAGAVVSETVVVSSAFVPRLGPALLPNTNIALAVDAAVDTPVDATATAEGAAAEVTSTPTPGPTPAVATAIIEPEQMNARRGPSTRYEVVTSLLAGTELEILAFSPQGDWYQVKLAGQEEPAWIFAELAQAVGPLDKIARLSEDQLPAEPTPDPAAPEAQVAAASVNVAPAPPPSGGGSFGYGIQAHMLAGESDRAIGAAGDMGFNWVKQQVVWAQFQPQPGAVGFGELGGIVSVAGQRGINVLFSVVNAPEWARGPGSDGSVGGPPADPQTYASFVGAMAGEFCGTALKAIEVWNEQNLHYEWGNKPLDPADYMNLLKSAYTSIKAACPEMLVISGALTPAGSNPPFAVDDFAYLEGMYQNGLASYSDGIGAHPSGYNVPASVRWEDACSVIQQTGNTFNGACDTPHHSWSFRSTMEGYRNIMVVYGDANKRIWPTEFGWAAGGAFDPRYAYANDNSFDEQAAWTAEAYQMMKEWGWVGPAFLWNLNFRVVADGSEKAQWGIVRNDYSPLPVYQALQAMPK